MIARLLSALSAALCLLLAACASPQLRGTGDLGVVIERAGAAACRLSNNAPCAAWAGWRAWRFIARLGGVLARWPLRLCVWPRRRLESGGRAQPAAGQAGDAGRQQHLGRFPAMADCRRKIISLGGVKLFDADTLELLAEISTNGSKVVGLADLPGNRFAFSPFEAGETVIDASQPRAPVTRYPNIGRQPTTANSQDGCHYLAGLYGEDGLALLDTWQPDIGAPRLNGWLGAGAPRRRCTKCRTCAAGARPATTPFAGHRPPPGADRRPAQLGGSRPRGGARPAGVFVMAEPGGRRGG